MAYTRIHAIKSTVAKAVAYICNPDKTEQQLLVDSFDCSPETARHDFEYALSRTTVNASFFYIRNANLCNL